VRHSAPDEEQHNAQLVAAVAASNDAIISIGTDLAVHTWNAGAQRMFGYTEAEARGHRLSELIVPDVYKDESAGILASVLSGETVLKEVLRRHRGGQLIPVEISVSPIRDRSGNVIGTSVIYRDISERRRAEEARLALAVSDARFRITFENAPVGIANTAPDGRFLRVNEALCRFLGYSADELATKSFQDVTHPDDLAASVAATEQIRGGKIGRYDADKRYLRKDGATVWARLTFNCVRKSDGSIDYFVGVVEDITARKHAEERVHLLMREANHRIKNILGLVQAIARPIAALEPQDFMDRFAERIQALAANQDLLVRNAWRGVDIENLVHSQLAHLDDLVGSRIAVSGKKLRLNADAAQAIGLALHELATNAGKYGALSTEDGHVDISWQLDGDILSMEWKECGGPRVQVPERRGFGSTVIDAMVKQTVGGEVQLDYAPSGLEWRLTCPGQNALEDRG
jgi:PAS domain S-box-containing protein